jgi:hypothetical protein
MLGERATSNLVVVGRVGSNLTGVAIVIGEGVVAVLGFLNQRQIAVLREREGQEKEEPFVTGWERLRRDEKCYDMCCMRLRAVGC